MLSRLALSSLNCINITFFSLYGKHNVIYSYQSYLFKKEYILFILNLREGAYW